MNCKHCHKPLDTSIRIDGYKSCPSCSQRNPNQEHVFYPDSYFGTTIHRITNNNPDGIQSHCTSCRGEKTATNGTQCNQI